MSSLFKVSDQLQREMLGELCARNIAAHLEYRPEEGPKIDARVRFLHMSKQQVLIDLPVVAGRPVMVRPGESIRLFFLWKGQRFAVSAVVRQRAHFKAGDSASLEALAVQYPKEIERAQRRECFRLSLLHLSSATLRLCRVTDPKHPERSRPAAEPAGGKKAASTPLSDADSSPTPSAPAPTESGKPAVSKAPVNSIAQRRLKLTLAMAARQIKPEAPPPPVSPPIASDKIASAVATPTSPQAGSDRAFDKGCSCINAQGLECDGAVVPCSGQPLPGGRCAERVSPAPAEPIGPAKEQAITELSPAPSPSGDSLATEIEAPVGPPPLDPDAPFAGRLLNLSETGCGAVFEKVSTPPFDIGQLFHVDFSLPTQGEPLYLIAQVRWVKTHPAGDRVMAGMAWQLDPSERRHREVQSQIGRFIAAEQREVLRRARTE